MKAFLIIFLTLACGLVQAQERNIREATAAEMAAGTAGLPAVVTPRRAGAGGAASGVTNGQANVGFKTTLMVTNTAVGVGNNDSGRILGVADNFYGNNPVWGISIYGDAVTYWSADPQSYAGYLPNFNSTIAAGPISGQTGIPHYLWNDHIVGLNIAGDDRTSTGIEVTYGTNGEYGSIIELLPLKNSHATLSSARSAHPLRLDGSGGVWVGNIPEAKHTLYYPANAYLRITTGGNVDNPALYLDSDSLITVPVAGSIEKSNQLYYTDNTGVRKQVFTVPTNGVYGGLPTVTANQGSGVGVGTTGSAGLYTNLGFSNLDGSFAVVATLGSDRQSTSPCKMFSIAYSKAQKYPVIPIFSVGSPGNVAGLSYASFVTNCTSAGFEVWHNVTGISATSQVYYFHVDLQPQ